MMQHVADEVDFFKRRILLRPQEISNHPEIVRRLGIVSMNTAVELDLGGNVNSTHVMGKTMLNGIGGSGDFTRNAYLSIFSCPSTAKGGAISAIVPLVSHADHSEHSVQVVVTEQGIADLRGHSPHERAELIIQNCAHPDYREALENYVHMVKKGHTPQTLQAAFAFHRRYLDTGDMHGVNCRALAEV
jgi:acetyl-CoA hydrolase